MNVPQKAAVILGAAGPIGAALTAALTDENYDRVIVSDTASKRGILSGLLPHLSISRDRIRIEEMDPALPLAGLPESLLTELSEFETDVFHLAHRMDRSLAASDIHPHNTLVLERVFALSYALKKVHSVCVVTDIGLVGDFPGIFSESWTDAGQTPFDDVDKSSLQIELACIEEKRLPIIRFRTGLTLLPPSLSSQFPYWRKTSDVLLSSVKWLAKLPRFITLPAAVKEGASAPVTPAEWAAAVMLHFAFERKGLHESFHLVVDPKPTMEAVLAAAAETLGGARIKGGLPTNLIAKLGRVPGFKETARRNADQVAAWWTPHRYCLSKNDVDTAHLRALLPPALSVPSWNAVKSLMT